MDKVFYFDNNATTRCAPEVVEAMLPFFSERYGNASSMHAFGGAVAADVKVARAKVADFLRCQPDEVVFTSCGSESDNNALFGAVEALGPDTTVITSAVEHPAVLEPCRWLEENRIRVVRIGVDRLGALDMDAYRAALAAPGPKLVSLMWANNETGVVFPIRECAELAKAAGAVFHTDATQAAGKLAEVDMSGVPADMLSFSGHKLHAPKGIGVLYIRRGTPVRPFLLGGHQEKGRRAGTENVPYIVGLGRAVEMAREEIDGGEVARIARMRDRLQEGLLKIPDTVVNGDPARRLPNTLNVAFEWIEGEAILFHLSDAGICASSGSACTS
ncbi:MAG: aminotransferase class V-fold PLP-dependent enzyme, partial [Kiritimatiellae bacterium]|nr:aminotransferase class V-fold PLP-dependent enzyme [Kiritimatiellia bacterium]